MEDNNKPSCFSFQFKQWLNTYSPVGNLAQLAAYCPFTKLELFEQSVAFIFAVVVLNMSLVDIHLLLFSVVCLRTSFEWMVIKYHFF